MTWILVASGSEGYIYSENDRAELSLVRKFELPEVRVKSKEPGDEVNLALIRTLTQAVEEGKARGQFDQLILVAGAKALAPLKEGLSKPTRERVIGTFAKKLGSLTDHERNRTVFNLLRDHEIGMRMKAKSA